MVERGVINFHLHVTLFFLYLGVQRVVPDLICRDLEGMALVLQPWVAESKGRQNEYFEWGGGNLCSTDFQLLSRMKGN